MSDARFTGERMTLKCPHCGREKIVSVRPVIPVQKFDLRCCGGQTVTTKVIRTTGAMTIREVTWER